MEADPAIMPVVIPWQKPIGSDRAGTALLLGLILLTMLTFTLPALIKDLPYRLETDEEDWVPPAVRMAAGGTANPGWFGHPGATVLYPLGAIYQLVYDPTFTENEMIWERFWQGPSNFIWIGRMLSLFYAFAALPLVFLLGRRLSGDRIGLLGTWLFVLTPYPLYYATIVRSDSAATFFSLLTLLLCLEYAKKPTVAGALSMGAGAALAIATRFFMAALLPAIVLTIISAHGWREIRTWISRAMLTGLAVAVVFVLVCPFAVLDSATLLKDLRHEGRSTNLGSDGLNLFQNFWWYLTVALPGNLTWPTWILALAGLWRMAKKRDARCVPIVTFLCVTLVGISVHPLHSFRWTIQILPLLALCAGLAVDAMAKRYSASPISQRIFCLSAAFILSLWPFTGNTIGTIALSNPSTFQQARHWITAHLPPGTGVLDAAYYIDPFQRTHVRSILHTSIPTFDHLAALRAEGITYVMIDSFVLKEMRKHPEHYPKLQYMNAVETDSQLLITFPPSSFIRGPSIRIYKLRP